MHSTLHDSLVHNLARARAAISPSTGRTMFDPDVISLCSGEGLCRPHPAVIARSALALFDTRDSTLDNYRFLQRHVPLERLVMDFMQDLGLTGPHAAEVMFTNGVTRVLEAFILCHTAAGSVSFISCNYYHPLPKLFELLRRKVMLVPEDESVGGGRISAASLETAIEDARAIYGRNVQLGALLLFNPGYTGEVYDEETLSGIAATLCAHELPVLEDAIFAGLEFDACSHRLAACMPDDHVAITATGGSKVFGMANVRVAWAVGTSAAIEPMSEFTVCTNPGNFWVSLEGMRGALASRASFLPPCIAELKRRAGLVAELCEEVNVASRQFDVSLQLRPVRSPLAGHSVLLDAERVGRRLLPATELAGGYTLATRLLQDAGVAFSPAGSHGHPQRNFLRVCHASVGAEATYAESACAEQQALGELLMDLATGRVQSARERVAEIELQPFLPPVEGWSKGRSLLAEAFSERFIPWISGCLRARH